MYTYRFKVTKNVKYRPHAQSIFQGTDIDKIITIPKGTYVEVIPVSYLNLLESNYTCESCDTRDDKEKCNVCKSEQLTTLMIIFLDKNSVVTTPKGNTMYSIFLESENLKVVHTDSCSIEELPIVFDYYKVRSVKCKV